jgi:hypothetical protein
MGASSDQKPEQPWPNPDTMGRLTWSKQSKHLFIKDYQTENTSINLQKESQFVPQFRLPIDHSSNSPL